MIVPMKKVAVVCLADDRDSCLQQLQELGLLHISSVAEESDPSLISTRESLIHAEEAKSFLLLHSADDEGETTPCTMPADQMVDYVLKLRERMQEIADKRSAVIRTIAIYEPFGDFNPQQAAELADKGLSVHLLRQPNSQPLPSSGDGIIQILSEDRSNRSMVAIGDVEITESATEIPLPERSLAEEQKELNDFNEELIAIEKELSSLTESADSLTAEIEIRNEQNEFATAKAGMQRDREVSVLQGFIPEGCEDALTKAAAAHKWALLIRNPESNDAVPTLIKTPAWVKPIKAVFSMLGITPGYREADTSMVFMLFFSVFFAMLIGDAGYGLIFLLATLFARRKLPKAPAYPFTLMGVLSVSTIIWGVVTANYFGITPGNGPAWTGQITWLGDEGNLMKLCFIIGAVHLTIAHIWNAIVLFPARKAYAQIGWIGIVWSTFFAACNMVLGQDYPSWILFLFLGGLALVLLFMTDPKELKEQWIDHAMLPLSIVSCLVDVISYIRLFAVGMASLQVASSFNEMAMELGLPLALKIPVVALILLLGHGLNIILGALAILVHAVRLNTLEFSQHKGLEWTGFAYNPFKKANKD